MEKINEDEASLNESSIFQKNLFPVIKKIFPDRVDYLNNNYFKDHNKGKTDSKDIQGFNLFSDDSTKEENQEQMDSFQSSSKSLARLYFISKNKINDSIPKEEDKLLNKKKKRDKIFLSKKIANKNKLCKKYNFGRKPKEDKNIGKHNSSSKDNIMNKIKTHFFHYIRDIIKKNSNHKDINIIKFRTEFVADLKKDKNVDLLETKIKDILKNQPISTKNKKSDEYENSLIIDKIYQEKKEVKVMKILELTFKELFIIFRKKLKKPEDKKELKKIGKKIEGLDLIKNKENKENDYDDVDYLKADIRKRNSKNNKMNETELKEYINKVSKACLDYEKWFYEKIGRVQKRLIK